ncbi:hypothetical protein P7C70_g5011, partial [Phenoliferia sp. Uapishka_3]
MTNPIDPNANRPIRVLSFDADIAGDLSALLVADHLARQLGDLGSPAKLNSFFDLIVGSGFGGVNALLLGRLGMSTDEAWARCVEMRRALFPPGTLDQALGANRLSLEPLRDFMHDLSYGALLEVPEPVQCRSLVLVTSASIPTNIPVRLRSYLSIYGGDYHPWSVAEASCAAVSNSALFNDFEVDGHTFTGVEASGLTNPAYIALSEVEDIRDNNDDVWNQRMESNGVVVVSIGTGARSLLRAGGNSRNQQLAELYKATSLSTAVVHDELSHRFQPRSDPYFPQGRYFRFDTPELGTLDYHDPRLESSKLPDVLTNTYFQSAQTRALLQDCGEALKSSNKLNTADITPQWQFEPSAGSDSFPSFPSAGQIDLGPAIRNRNTPLAPPPFDRQLVGRQVELGDVLQCLQKNGNLAIVGLAGIGKTALATSAVHDARIMTTFKRRVFIRCVRLETLQDFQLELLRIRAPRGLEPGENLAEAVGIVLRQVPTLLILDGLLDSPSNTHADFYRYISTLTEISNINLLITTRNTLLSEIFTESPDVLCLHLSGLSDASSKTLFRHEFHRRDHSYELSTSNPLLHELLQLLDGVPLAIKLVAGQARSEASLQDVINSWNDGLVWDNNAVRNDGEESLGFSLSLSLRDCSHDTIALLRLLSELPHPILRQHQLASPGIRTALDGALRCSIAQVERSSFEDGSVRILEPVRHYVRRLSQEVDVNSDVVRELALSYFANGRWNSSSTKWARTPEDENFCTLAKIMKGTVSDDLEQRRVLAVLAVIEGGYMEWQERFELLSNVRHHDIELFPISLIFDSAVLRTSPPELESHIQTEGK